MYTWYHAAPRMPGNLRRTQEIAMARVVLHLLPGAASVVPYLDAVIIPQELPTDHVFAEAQVPSDWLDTMGHFTDIPAALGIDPVHVAGLQIAER